MKIFLRSPVFLLNHVFPAEILHNFMKSREKVTRGETHACLLLNVRDSSIIPEKELFFSLTLTLVYHDHNRS